MSSDEESLDWGDWEEDTKALHHGWNVEGKHVSKRNQNKPPPRHKETADRAPSKKMQQKIQPRWINADKDSSRIRHAIKGKPVKKKKKLTDATQTETSEKKKSTDATQTDTSGNASTVTAPTVDTVGSDSKDSQSVEQKGRIEQQ